MGQWLDRAHQRIAEMNAELEFICSVMDPLIDRMARLCKKANELEDQGHVARVEALRAEEDDIAIVVEPMFMRSGHLECQRDVLAARIEEFELALASEATIH